MTNVDVRPAREGDLEALTAIYNTYVVDTAITFDVTPLTVAQRRPWFDECNGGGRHRLVVAEEAGRVLGYACSHRHRPKPAYDTSVETSVYVAAGATGRGLGSRLYTALFDLLRGQDVHRAFAGVALPNAASVALHRRFGFERLGVFREVGRKFGRYWDVEWFEKPLD